MKTPKIKFFGKALGRRPVARVLALALAFGLLTIATTTTLKAQSTYTSIYVSFSGTGTIGEYRRTVRRTMPH